MRQPVVMPLGRLHASGVRVAVRALGAVGAAGLVTLAHGQTGDAAQATAPGAQAGSVQAPRRVVAFVPRVSLESTWTDNIRDTPDKVADLVTTVRPGFRFTADGDRLKASVDYSLSRLVHARNRSLDRNQNALRARGSLEMVENFAFVDFSGNISQQTISAFSPRSGDAVSSSANSTETSLYRLAPYVRGALGDWFNYEARYARTASRSKSSLAGGDYDMNDLSLQLHSRSPQRALNWTLSLTRQEQDYAAGRSTEADRVRAVLSHAVNPQLTVALIPGWEANNYASLNKESAATYGGEVQWAPSERTKVSALLEKRFFGRAHMVSLEHRTPRSAWRFSDSRDASTMSSRGGGSSPGTVYDLYFLLFESIEPDDVRRAQLVNAYLAAYGLDGSTGIDLGFLTSAVTLSRRQDLSFSLTGQRDTLTFLLSQSETSRLLNTGQTGDLASSSAVRQHGFSVIYSRRLTSLSTLNVHASQSRSAGEFRATQGIVTRSVNVSMSTRLGDHVTGTVGLRRTISDNQRVGYNESAVRGGLNIQF